MACSETMGRRDAAHKPTWTYLRRVSEQAVVSQVGPTAPIARKRAAPAPRIAE